ncbi:beta-glucosidase 12-like isoform X3 [Rosa rugosa]|uniref:beta-glucosidase 12-like isoform X3 n=1 Tax=Rosa rugosa TaxID=74645 RepID=UPI002B416890|nr:beta-glucosidase 12-like isoform X3 [Rosa rugosa]
MPSIYSQLYKTPVMAIQGSLLLAIAFLVLGFGFRNGKASNTPPAQYDTAFLNRTSFPAGFIFGTASSSYQYEGAAHCGGRGPSIWDNYTHRYPEKIKDGSNGDVASDEYHRYKEDVGIMKNMELDAYRFSISWSRLLPNGKLTGGVNKEGVKYYNNLINELLRNGLKPFVTLFHWDLPQTLEDEYGGFLSPLIVNHFRDYAELCYKEFGDRELNCTGGNSGTEPYLVAHNQLLAHTAAVTLYKQKYQSSQKGLIGITLVSNWFVPVSEAEHHKNAALRALDYMFGWFMDPLTNGDYPHSMRSLVGNRLPKFTKEQSKLLIGSFDFLGLNYYTANYAADAPHYNSVNASYLTDAHATLSYVLNGFPIGPKAASDWLYVYPRGIRDLLLYTKTKYNDPLIYVTENGIDEFNDPKLTLEVSLNDTQRVDYYYRHLYYLQRAIKDGVNVKGYFAWSLLDNFEWNSGYTVRFGINYVDYKNGQNRHPKLSAHWFKRFLKKR